MDIGPKISRFLSRFRYPFSLPEDLAFDLGIPLQNKLKFTEVIDFLASPQCCPKTICKYMPRDQAEAAFRRFVKKEHFPYASLFSYHLNRGWVIVMLYFDTSLRLQRLSLQCPLSFEGFDLPLEGDFSAVTS